MSDSPSVLPGLPAALTRAVYPAEAWEQDAFAMFAEGRDPVPCPNCSRMGFYGPRVAGGGERYRGCRFCGFYQAIGEPGTLARPTAHGCANWPEIAKAAYVWWSPPTEHSYRCPFCGETVQVANHIMRAPSDDPQHPWWRVPQGKNRFYYARFWENWPFTKGRVFL